MKRSILLAVGVSILVSVVLVAVAQETKGPAKEAPNKPWEYGSLIEIFQIDSYSWDARPSTKERVEATSLAELFKKLGGAGNYVQGDYMRLYNLLGAQGWEFVDRRETKDGRDALFKRRK